MGVIHPVAKWNLEKNIWEKTNAQNVRRAFCFGRYEDVINDESTQDFHYIIIAEGSRTEDHTKDPENISDRELNINRVREFLKKQPYNYKVILFLMDADAPIIEDAKLFASKIDDYASEEHCKTVNLVGISKCGAMGFNIPKFFKKEQTFQKTNLYTIAVPYDGTKLASPKILFPEVETWVVGILGGNKFSSFVAKKLWSIQENINSNSHMDFDIAIPGGLFNDQLSKYDPTFIENMFSVENLNAQAKLRSHINIETGIDGWTLPEAIVKGDLTGIGLCMINGFFFNKKSDGLVLISSQEKIADYIPNVSRVKLKSAHHAVMTNARLVNDILQIVEQTIEEQIEKEKVRLLS